MASLKLTNRNCNGGFCMGVNLKKYRIKSSLICGFPVDLLREHKQQRELCYVSYTLRNEKPRPNIHSLCVCVCSTNMHVTIKARILLVRNCAMLGEGYSSLSQFLVILSLCGRVCISA